MKPSTYGVLSHQRGSSADTTTVATLTPANGTSAVLITVETTSARLTFDSSDPSAASAPSHVFPKDQLPVLLLLGPGAVIKWVSTAGTAAVVQMTSLR